MHNSQIPRAINAWLDENFEALDIEGYPWMLMQYGKGLWGFDFTGWDIGEQQGEIYTRLRINLFPEGDELKLQIMQEVEHLRTLEVTVHSNEYSFDDTYEEPQDFLSSIVAKFARERTSCPQSIESGCLKCTTLRDIARGIRELIDAIEKAPVSTSNFDWQRNANEFDEAAEIASLDRFLDEYLQ